MSTTEFNAQAPDSQSYQRGVFAMNGQPIPCSLNLQSVLPSNATYFLIDPNKRTMHAQGSSKEALEVYQINYVKGKSLIVVDKNELEDWFIKPMREEAKRVHQQPTYYNGPHHAS